MLRLLAALTVVLLTVFAAPAQSRSQRSKLRLSDLSGVPSQLTTGATFSVRGTVTARRAKARKVTVTVALKGGPTLGAKVVRRLRIGKDRGFRVRAVLPARGVAAGPYRLTVCARSGRAKKSRCRTRLVTVTTTGTGTGSPPPSATATPAPSPTATASPSPSPSPTPTGTPTPAPFCRPAATRSLPLPAARAVVRRGPPVQGAETVGDRLFPNLGNGGYDAQGYDLALTYTPVTHTLAGTATMTALATEDLSRFSLDFQGFTVSTVTVNGGAATFSRVNSGATHKLRVTPATPIVAGSTFTVTTGYSGSPPTITDPDGSDEGFMQTSDGAFVAGEPMGSMGWFPSNNHPSDKATFKLAMTVPAADTVVSNGLLLSDTANGLNHTMVWQETHPMATYLATATLGVFTVTQSTHDGLPYYDAIDPTAGPSAGMAVEPDVLALYDCLYGAYPFSIAGGIVDNAPTVGYSLETQTKPIYPLGPIADEATVSHELGHQYWGDSLSPARWEDIWLNEGFAEFSSWRFLEQTGDSTTQKRYEDFLADHPASDSDFWGVAPAAPATAADLFDTNAMYNRGAMTLEALREIIGDDATFYGILRTWASEHAYGNVTTSQFIDLVKARSGKDPARIGAFFQDWLYDTDRPTITPQTF